MARYIAERVTAGRAGGRAGAAVERTEAVWRHDRATGDSSVTQRRRTAPCPPCRAVPCRACHALAAVHLSGLVAPTVNLVDDDCAATID